MAKRQLKGIVVSDKMRETAVVAVRSVHRHPKYLKEYERTTRLKAHNPESRYHTGEAIIIEETRPLSKEKRWRIIRKV